MALHKQPPCNSGFGMHLPFFKTCYANRISACHSKRDWSKIESSCITQLVIFISSLSSYTHKLTLCNQASVVFLIELHLKWDILIRFSLRNFFFSCTFESPGLLLVATPIVSGQRRCWQLCIYVPPPPKKKYNLFANCIYFLWFFSTVAASRTTRGTRFWHYNTVG